MASNTGNAEIDSLRSRLEREPLEDVIEALAARRDELRTDAPDAVRELERDVSQRVARNSHGPWKDRKKAARAFRFYLDVALEQGTEDGDTRTWALVRALEQDPGDDELLEDYVSAVADTDYRYTDLSLGEIAESVQDRTRARWLAALDTVVEYFCLRVYLDPPKEVYVNALKRSFAGAVRLGLDEAGWQKARTWVLEKVPWSEVPEDLFARYAR